MVEHELKVEEFPMISLCLSLHCFSFEILEPTLCYFADVDSWLSDVFYQEMFYPESTAKNF